MHTVLAEQQEFEIPFGSQRFTSDLDGFRKYIMPRLPLYQLIAERSGFWIEFGEATKFDHNRRTIILGIDNFQKDGRMLSPDLIDYLILHELGHMKELYDDPEGYSDIIDSGQEKYGDAAFRLYNCLLDVYVNANTAQHASVYGDRLHASEAVKSFYRHTAFPNRDFSKQPHFLQMAHYLLNLGMDVADDVILSEEVQSKIDQGLVDLTGRKISYDNFLNTYMRPTPEEREDQNWKGTVSQRKEVIDRMLKPEFIKSLELDLSEGRAILVPGRPGVGSSFDSKTLKDILNDAYRSQKEGKLTAKDREMDRQLRIIGKGIDLPVADINNFIASYRRMKDVIYKLAKIWEELTFIGVANGWKNQGHYISGTNLDINRAVNTFSTIMTSPESSKVMLRRFPYEERLPVPREFNLRLILDTSGSMEIVEEMARDVAVALGASLFVKNQESILQKSNIRCGLEVRRFSGDARTIMDCTQNITMESLLKWYPEVKMGGGTMDHFALEAVAKSIDADATEQIKSGKRVEIVIEITDGDTGDPSATRKEIAKLKAKGVLVGAINLSPRSIGAEINSIEEELGATGLEVYKRMSRWRGTLFEQIWNSEPLKRGINILSPDELPDALLELLKRFIASSPGITVR